METFEIDCEMKRYTCLILIAFFLIQTISVFGQKEKNQLTTHDLAVWTGKWQSHLDEKYRNHPMIQKFNPELKPQIMEIKLDGDDLFLSLTIYDVDRPKTGDTTLLVQGFIIPDPVGIRIKMMENNVSNGNTYLGYYELDNNKNISRYFGPCPENENYQYKEIWEWVNDNRSAFQWHAYYYHEESNQYEKGDIIVRWEKIE